MNAIDFASSHRFISNALLPLYCGRLCLRVLITKNVPHLGIQFIRRLIDEIEIASLDLCSRLLTQILREHGFDESGTRLLRSCEAVDRGEDFLRQRDGGLLFHTTIILPTGDCSMDSKSCPSRASRFRSFIFLIPPLRKSIHFGITNRVEDK